MSEENNNKNITKFKNKNIDCSSIENDLSTKDNTENIYDKNNTNKDTNHDKNEENKDMASKIHQDNINNRKKILKEDEKHKATKPYDFDVKNKIKFEQLIDQAHKKQMAKMKKVQKYSFIISTIGLGLILLILFLEIYWIYMFQ